MYDLVTELDLIKLFWLLDFWVSNIPRYLYLKVPKKVSKYQGDH